MDNVLGVKNLQMQIEYYGTHFNFQYSKSSGWEIQGDKAVSVNERGDIFTLQVEKKANAVLYTPTIQTNAKQGYEKVLRFSVYGFLNCKPLVVLYNDADEVPVRNKSLYGMASPTQTVKLVKNQQVNGADYVAFKEEKGSGVVGAVTFDNYFSSVRLGEDGQFFFDAYANEHWLQLDTFSLNKKQRITLDTFAVIQTSDDEPLSSYGELLKERNGNRPPPQKPASGWCSWYYYGTNISEQKILDNMQIVEQKKLPFNLIQIDDGWQKQKGDWEANERFPNGMKRLADCIKQKGFTAGIWVAPFLFDKDAQVVQEHSEWFIFAHNRIYIDYSQEGAQAWLYDLFYKLSHEWGYRYIKVDLVQAALAYDGYCEEGFNAVKNLRKGYEIIRSAVTKDTHILACTTPIGAVAGLADSIRCEMDIFEMWSSLKQLASQTLKRLYVSKYATVDPDCLLVRTFEKQDEECYRLCTRTKEEIKTFITFLSVCGGAVMISDKLSLLDDEDFTLIKTLFPLNEKPCKALDLFENAIPSVFEYEECDSVQAYALINWSDKEEVFVLASEKKYSYAFWGKEMKCFHQKMEIVLQPHCSEIVYFADDEEKFKRYARSIMGEK